MIVIPFEPKYPEQTMSVVIDAKVFTLHFQWNMRFAYWTVDISDIDGLIIAGVKILSSVKLLASHGNERLPMGGIVITQNNAGLERIDRMNLGSAFSMLYMTEADLAAV